MSGGHHFHVHGPHDHAVEHASHSGDDFASRIAVTTALLATIGAIFSYQSGATQNEAMLQKNNAAIKKTEASNQWNYYQAKSNKQNLAELAVALNEGEKKKRYEQEVERYKAEKTEIMDKARKLEKEVETYEKKSDQALHHHHRWAQAMTAIQIAISLAAITLLTRKRWLNIATYVTATAGAILAGLAIAHI